MAYISSYVNVLAICSVSFLFFESDVFKQPVWDSLSEVDDPELKELAVFLPSVVLQSRAPSTVKKYSGAFSCWKLWASRKSGSIQIFPVKPLHLALYLAFLICKSSTCAPVLEAVHAVAWTHQIAGSQLNVQLSRRQWLAPSVCWLIAQKRRNQLPQNPQETR